MIAQTANKFHSEIIIERDQARINAKSIMGVITLAAGYNSQLTLRITGDDENNALQSLVTLFENKFEEE
jgi:phosphocarrier protein